MTFCNFRIKGNNYSSELAEKLIEAAKESIYSGKAAEVRGIVLRASPYMATVASLKHNPYLRSLYHRKISEGKESKQALICVGKKTISIMYSMLKYEADYDPQRIFFQFEKEQVLI